MCRTLYNGKDFDISNIYSEEAFSSAASSSRQIQFVDASCAQGNSGNNRLWLKSEYVLSNQNT